ncbi:hypothetical protein, partial [Sphingobacterium arenae]|uniref:hypothetical protein n=1 Tax=Sphingobacterium arenae TaxID=1280598 RepID=UPI0036366346
PEGAAGIPPFWSVRTVSAAHNHDRSIRKKRPDIARGDPATVHICLSIGGCYPPIIGQAIRRSLTYWDRKEKYRKEDRGSSFLRSYRGLLRRQSRGRQKGRGTEESR